MKYDAFTGDAVSYPGDNIKVKFRKKRKIDLLNVFIVQAAICAAVSCAVLITRFVSGMA